MGYRTKKKVYMYTCRYACNICVYNYVYPTASQVRHCTLDWRFWIGYWGLGKLRLNCTKLVQVGAKLAQVGAKLA